MIRIRMDWIKRVWVVGEVISFTTYTRARKVYEELSCAS